MPYKPGRPCMYPGCPNLTYSKSRYCEEHRRQEQQVIDQRRGTSAQRGYGSRWRKYRAWFLRMNPLCVMCKAKGRIAPSTVVDHKIAVDGPDDPLFWETSNHQALCGPCHGYKTATEDGAFIQKERGGNAIH